MQGMSGNEPRVNRSFRSSTGLHTLMVVRASEEMSRTVSSIRFPGHALHEKGLQRQIGVGTLASSKERRALLVPRLNRGSTGGHPLVNRSLCSSTCLHKNSSDRACEEMFRAVFGVTLEG